MRGHRPAAALAGKALADSHRCRCGAPKSAPRRQASIWCDSGWAGTAGHGTTSYTAVSVSVPAVSTRKHRYDSSASRRHGSPLMADEAALRAEVCSLGGRAPPAYHSVCGGGVFSDASRWPWLFPLTLMHCVCVCVCVCVCGTQRPKRKESWPRIAVGVLIIVCCVTVLVFRALRHKFFVALGCIPAAPKPLARFASVPGSHAGGPASPMGQAGAEGTGHQQCGQAASQQACS